MDFSRVADLKKIKEVLTFGDKHLHLLRDVDPAKRNVVGLTGYHMEG